jgi:hypothetical protein
MRQFISLAESDLTERAEQFDVRGRDVVVHSNPTANTLEALLANAQFGMVRGFAVNNDIFFWDASKAIHADIWRQVTDQFHEVRLFMMGFDLQTVVDDARREYEKANFFTFIEDPEVGFFYVAAGAEGDLMGNPAFQRMFNPRIIDVSEEMKRSLIENTGNAAALIKAMAEKYHRSNLKLIALNHDTVEIRWLHVPAGERHDGKGRQIMTDLMRTADQLSVDLELFPRSDVEFGNAEDDNTNALGQIDLESWYERLGFEFDADSDLMLRKSARPLTERMEKFDVRDREVIVHIDPTPNTTRSLIANAKYGLVRGVTFGASVYIWDANSAIHQQIYRQMTDDITTVAPFMAATDFDKLLGDAAGEIGGTSKMAFFTTGDVFVYVPKHSAAQMLANPAFKKLFSGLRPYEFR